MTTTSAVWAKLVQQEVEGEIAGYTSEHGPMGYALAKKYRKLLVDIERWKLEGNSTQLRSMYYSYRDRQKEVN